VDPDIVERARRGDRDAYEQLALFSSRRLYATAVRILRDRDLADDALQATLVAIWRELPSLRDPARFDAWSYRLLVRFCTAELRRRGRLTMMSNTLDLDRATDDDVGGLVNRDLLERAFARLSPDHRAVVVLVYYHGLKGAEAAEALGISQGTVASRLHHALRQLRAAIEADDRALPPLEPAS
jgi:RNA polymerase sigma-70 factor, ECF subfamily